MYISIYKIIIKLIVRNIHFLFHRWLTQKAHHHFECLQETEVLKKHVKLKLCGIRVKK